MKEVLILEERWIYLACAFDAEGYFGIWKDSSTMTKVGYTFIPKITVANTNFEWIKFLRSLVGGGSLTLRKVKRAKDQLMLRISSRLLRKVLPRIQPYLIIKARHAELLAEMLKILEYRVGGPGVGENPYPKRAEEVYRELRKLNKRGVAPRIAGR